MTPCDHKNLTFFGFASLVGSYRCDECGAELDPVFVAKRNGDLNIQLLDYYAKHPDRLNVNDRDHPWIRHLYKNV